MAQISRLVAPGYPHHVTQRGARSILIFSSDKGRSAYADIMAEQLHRFGVEVLAWCLITIRTHLVAVPKDQAALARAIGEAHRRYTRMKNFADGVQGVRVGFVSQQRCLLAEVICGLRWRSFR